MTQASNGARPEFLIDQLKVALPGLTRSEARIAQWLILNEQAAVMETGAPLAAKTGVSEITVGRFMRAFGLNAMVGLRDRLRGDILARQVSADSRRQQLHESPLGNILRAEAEAALALSAQFENERWAEALAKLTQARTVHVTGFQSIRGLADGMDAFVILHQLAAELGPATARRLAAWPELLKKVEFF